MFAQLRTITGSVVVLRASTTTTRSEDCCRAHPNNLHLIAAGRSDSLHSQYRHWTKPGSTDEGGVTRDFGTRRR